MATTDRIKVTAVWILSGLLGLLYLFAGGTKLAGMQTHVEHFARWGYPDWFRLVVGTIEVVCGAALLVPGLAFYAAVALGMNMLGAIYTELFRGEPPRAAFPLVLLLLLAVVAYARRPAAMGLPVRKAKGAT